MSPMRKWLRRYVTAPLTQTLAEASWFGFVTSAILLAAVVNVLSGVLLETMGALGTVLILATLALLTLAFANWYAWRRRRQIAAVIMERPHPQPRQGLIVMVTGAPTAAKAIEYHASALRHLWLIVTPAMRKEALDLRAKVEETGVQCHPLDLTQEYDASGCYALVKRVFEQLAPDAGLAQGDVVADMTGGTKPMTAGMVLACNDLGAALEHVPTKFVGDGQPTVPLDPIEVVIGRSG